jgi:hypothetical protein
MICKALVGEESIAIQFELYIAVTEIISWRNVLIGANFR